MKNARKRIDSGFTLLEVLIGMVVFALGMMALAQLQGNLSKSSADANARSVAINIAEETVEAARTFTQVTAGTGVTAFNHIVSKTETIQRGGIKYKYKWGNARFEQRKVKKGDVRNFPPRLLVQLVVMSTESHTASAKVIYSVAEMHVGTMVEPR